MVVVGGRYFEKPCWLSGSEGLAVRQAVQDLKEVWGLLEALCWCTLGMRNSGPSCTHGDVMGNRGSRRCTRQDYYQPPAPKEMTRSSTLVSGLSTVTSHGNRERGSQVELRLLIGQLGLGR